MSDNIDPAQFDLTQKIAFYLDRHLAFPLLEFNCEKDVFNKEDLEVARLELLKKTNMVDFAKDVFQTIFPDKEVPASFDEQREIVITQLDYHNQRVAHIKEMFANEEFKRQMESTREGKTLLDHLVKNHKFESERDLPAIYDYAMFQFSCGNYSDAGEMLYFYGALVDMSNEKALPSYWGKLACSILNQDWDAANDDMNKLKDLIDSNSKSSPLQVLQQRTWFLHWSLFVYFNHPKGCDNLIELFLYKDHYLNTIQTMCPWMLRYLAAAVITNKKRRQTMKELTRVVQQECYVYKDPITEFIECLYVNFDFERAQQKLRECESVLMNDFFLTSIAEEFMNNAREFVFETFCRIHQCISIDKLALKLNMSEEDAEHWVVNLIRNSPFKLNAKIDSQRGHVVMETSSKSVHDQVIDKTKTLVQRTQMLSMNAERRVQKQKDKSNDSQVPHWAEGGN